MKGSSAVGECMKIREYRKKFLRHFVVGYELDAL